MSNYALDINNPIIKNAMKNLGIQDSELEQREIDDFYEKGLNEGVKQIRFEHHKKKLQETVRLIRAFIKEERGRRAENLLNRNEMLETDTNSFEFSKRPTDISPSFEKNNEIIAKALREIEREEKVRSVTDQKLKTAKQIKEKHKADFSKRKSKIDEYKNLQKLNLDKLRREEQRMQNEILKRVITSSPRLYKTDENRFSDVRSKSNSVFTRRIARKSFPDSDSSDSETQARLNFFYSKIEKSKANYELQMQLKRDIASRKQSDQSVKTEIPSDLNVVEKALKIISKHKRATERRSKSVMKLREEREKLKKKHLDRFSSAQEKVKENDKEIVKKSEYLERKLKASQNVLEQKQAGLARNLEIKAELYRLKGKDTLANAERQRRVLVFSN